MILFFIALFISTSKQLALDNITYDKSALGEFVAPSIQRLHDRIKSESL